MPALDHLVYGTPDLEATVASLSERLGVAPAVGGSHPGLGTRNYLYSLGNGSYFEIVGPDLSQDVAPQWFGVAALTRPRMVGWAIRTAKIDLVVAGARERGYDPGNPVAMSRQGSDGSLLEWQLTMPPADPVVPFLVDWGTTRHPSGRGLPVVTLESFGAEHPDPLSIRRVLGTLGVGLELTRAAHTRLKAVLTGTDGRVELS